MILWDGNGRRKEYSKPIHELEPVKLFPLLFLRSVYDNNVDFEKKKQ